MPVIFIAVIVKVFILKYFFLIGNLRQSVKEKEKEKEDEKQISITLIRNFQLLCRSCMPLSTFIKYD